MNRRELLVGTASALVAGTTGPAFAQFKPTRPIEFVVHGGPGSGNDVFARTLTTIIDQEQPPLRFIAGAGFAARHVTRAALRDAARTADRRHEAFARPAPMSLAAEREHP